MSERNPSWPAPNYVNPKNMHSLILALTIPSMVLLVIFLAIRCYSRGVLRQNMKWDDHLMIIAACCSIPVSIFSLESLNLGLGLHMWDQRPEWNDEYSKMAFAADILFPIACSLTKISLCLTYLRLFPSTVDRVFCYIISTFLGLYTVTCILLMLFQCAPIRGYWDKTVDFQCIDMRLTLITLATLNSISDILVYLWPAKPLWSLQLPLRQRLGLICLFSVGTTVCVCGGIRMYFLEEYFSSDDYLWNAAKVYVCMTLEMNLGIICGCLSGVRPVLAVLFPRYFKSTEKTPSGPSYVYSISHSRRRPTRPDSTQFETLSDRYDSLRTVDAKGNIMHSKMEDNLSPMRIDQGKSFAWVDTHVKDDARSEITEVPLGAIKVKTVVMTQEEDAQSGTASGRRSITGSDDWILADTSAWKKE
ncbi:unnamed protein product [Periconia digitata]|uniref:Rhodopsin domain-containing protein n=1 Tax=Periconia digitata TaxID=1303443 RepID=A0A9W4U661_9PLEO|nr:unnamed protein product [Periconia digitata]